MSCLLDSNVFIQAKNFYYGFDFAPAFWDWIDREHANGNVFSVERVRDELIAGDDELADWAKDRGKDFFLPPDNDVLPSLSTLATWARSGRYEAGAANQFLDSADYYLVAHAHAHGFEVVTHERPSDSIKKIKIPDACIAHDVKTANLYGLIRTTKARFVLGQAG
jgi:Domain of unknown function (DUF4411)